MTTLHIEHPISGFDTWKSAFDRFEQKRADSGVTAHRIYQPVGRDDYIVVQLDFATPAEAEGFEGFLRTQVWSSPERSPGLAGEPRTLILDPAPRQ